MPQLETFQHYLESQIEERTFQRISTLNTSKFSRLPDSELADLLSSGDRGAASEFWERYSRSVRGILKRILGPQENVETLLQKVFQIVYREIGEARGQVGLGPCTLEATIRVSRTELQSRKRISIIPGTGSRKKKDSLAEDLTDNSWTLNFLYQLYDRLDADSRLAFILRQLEQMDLDDVAKSLGWSQARTAKSIEKTQATILARAREIVTPHTGSYDRDSLIEKKDTKSKRDAAALRVMIELTRENIDGVIESPTHFAGRELFMEGIDLNEINDFKDFGSKKPLLVVLLVLFLVALGLFFSFAIRSHWSLENPDSFSQLDQQLNIEDSPSMVLE